MKILATGVTKQQAGGGTTLGYEPVSELFVRALTLAGHAVDHRVPEAGEDLSGYDAMLLGVVPFFSIASKNLYPTLHAFDQARSHNLPVVTYVDDWGFPQLIANLKTHLRQPHQLVKPFFKGRTHHEWALDHQDRLMAVVQRLLHEPWGPTLLPAFSWGAHQKLRDLLPVAPDVTFVDPSVLAREYPIEPARPAERRREWVLGTVSNQTAWLTDLGLTWPVDHLGTKTARAPIAVPEANLVARYGNAWGVLSPPYKRILGTGWWRNRFVYAMRAGAILLCDPAEAAALGPAYTLSSVDVENATMQSLEVRVEAQREAFLAWQPPVDVVVEQVAAALTRARRG